MQYVIAAYLAIGILVLIWKWEKVKESITEAQLKTVSGRKTTYFMVIISTVLMWWLVFVGKGIDKLDKSKGNNTGDTPD